MVYGLFHFVLSPVNGLFATVARGTCRELDTSNAMPGPHAFSVRNKALSSLALLASTASCPASVTISSRPSMGQDGGEYRGDLGFRKNRIFFEMRLDRDVAKPPDGQITCRPSGGLR